MAVKRTKKTKRIYTFGAGKADGDAGMKDLLGGKGANLAEMCRIGLPVPPGFTIAATACRDYHDYGHALSGDLVGEAHAAIRRLEKTTGKGWGDPSNPLLVSVRSGAAISMPGMMDTVLNLGLTEEVTEGLAALSGNRRFALDARRRFIQMFGNVVEGLDHRIFERLLASARRRAGVEDDTDLGEADLEHVVADYLEAYEDAAGHAFPTDPHDQLERAIGAVFGSWDGNRAVEYRRIHKIEGLLGTAVTVQSMVFGNLGEDSGTGVCFTRDPATGENVFYGEFLMNAQGEDVVAGIRTPEPLDELTAHDPKAHAQLTKIRATLEKHYRDIQDIEFTIEQGTLYLLQTRAGKRTAQAAVRIAVEMTKQRLITRKEAVTRVSPDQLNQLLHPQFDPDAPRDVITRGLPASPGAVSGRIVFTAEDAKEQAVGGESLILVRNETSPEDVGGMHAAQGILTATGGMTSHAAVVARGMGTCCVAGAGEVRIDEDAKVARIGKHEFREGDVISLDGTTGQVMVGSVKTIPAEPTEHFETLLGWADRFRRLRVRTNADTPADARVARRYGAEGIGLCRTEHMFFGDERIAAMREMILAEDETGRRKALDKLLPYQREDFAGILGAMDGLPVTIRLLDPPLHEFLPHDAAQAAAVAEALDISTDDILDRAARLKEANPMLGHRGCRLGLTYPEIYEMQVRAIYLAAADVKASGKRPIPEVMIPLVGAKREFDVLKARLAAVAKATLREVGIRMKVVFGTMIEVPRAALTADAIAEEAEFFSFGTNDLTQLTFGFSRDDVGSFLPAYVADKILPAEPFQTLDRDGVGQLVRLAFERGRATRPKLKVGICGEHGGDPESIAFCEEVGLDYVSCSPFRVPIARLAAAQATLSLSESVSESISERLGGKLGGKLLSTAMSDAGRRIFCFGLGYSAEVLTRRLQAHGWSVAGTSRDPDRRRALEDLGFEMVPFDRETPVSAGVLAQTTHVLTSVATDTEGDPVLGVHARDLADLPTLTWAGYLSSTTVYGDHGGATVNEDSQLRPTQERSVRRAAAERAWLASGLPAHVFRLGGIYGPGRNVIQGLRTGRTRHVVRAGQVFSRIHVEDIATTIEASIAQPEPLLIYNVTDDEPCGVSAVLEFTAALLGVPCPPPVSFEEADLTPAARKFYLDSRRVSNRRIREGLGVELRYPTYREGITALALDA